MADGFGFGGVASGFNAARQVTNQGRGLDLREQEGLARTDIARQGLGLRERELESRIKREEQTQQATQVDQLIDANLQQVKAFVEAAVESGADVTQIADNKALRALVEDMTKTAVAGGRDPQQIANQVNGMIQTAAVAASQADAQGNVIEQPSQVSEATGQPRDPRADAITQAEINKRGSTKGEIKLDQEFSKDVVSFGTGGFADVQKGIRQLEFAIDQLAKSKTAEDGPLTGASPGNTPDFILQFTRPEAIDVRDTVSEVTQRNLKLILGAQFTEREGERLIQRAFDPRQPADVNIRRVNALLTQMKTAAQQKILALEHWQKFGTLRGFRGLLPSVSDFESVLTDAAQSAPRKRMRFNPDTNGLEGV